MDTINTDIMSRYSELKPGLPPVQSVADREQKLSEQISQGDTLAGYLVGLKGQELNVRSLISMGKTAEAKEAYDDMVSTIDANRAGITAVASMRGGGTNAKVLVDAANRALLSGFNDEEVKTVDGDSYKVGEYFSNDRLWKNPGSSFRNRGFSRRSVDAMLNSEDEGLRRSLGFFMKDVNYTANRKAGVDFDSMHIQNNEAADAVYDNWNDIRATFGDGAERFVQYVHETHVDSGASAPMLKAFCSFAKQRSAHSNLKGDSLVSDVMGGYRELVDFVNQGDPAAGTTERQVSTNKRLMADATILKMVTEMEKAGGAGYKVDFRDDRVKTAFRECMAVMADATACGIDPTQGPSSVFAGFAGHVLDRASGRMSTGGFVNSWMRFDQGLRNQLSGGRDFRSIAAELTSDPADYLRLQRAAGGESSCPAADGIMADVRQSLKRTVGQYTRNGIDAATAWAKVSSDPTLAAERVDDLVKVISQSLSGRGRTVAARRLAADIIGTVENGGKLNLETRIRDLVADNRFRQTSPLAHESLSNWFYGNTEATLRYSYKFAQLERHWASPNGGGLSERSRASAMSRMKSRVAEASRMSEGPNKGIDPSVLIDNELRRGFIFLPTKEGVQRVPTDVNGNVTVTDPKSGKAVTLPLSAYLSIPGRYAEQDELSRDYLSPTQAARLKAISSARRKPDKNAGEDEEE